MRRARMFLHFVMGVVFAAGGLGILHIVAGGHRYIAAGTCSIWFLVLCLYTLLVIMDRSGRCS
jgi:hypothetical protein